MDVARLQVVIEANTSAVEAGFARTNTLLETLSQRAGSSSTSFGSLTSSFALGTVAANAFTGALSSISGFMVNAGEASLNLSSRLEQAKIGFTTMLGSAQAASQFIGELQAKAESTAFNFPGIQQAAQSLLAMGITGKNVIPIIDDISNALSAAGHGGDTDRLQRVGQSLSEIAAQGKLSGEQIRELSRNGIAILPLLSEAFGKTAAEIRKMSEESQISSEMFFTAFHSEVAMHYGDIQAQQAKTWAVAASNVQDILGRLSTETFAEFFAAVTQSALAVNDFLHSEQAQVWANNIKSAIHAVMEELAPFAAAIQAAMGIVPTAPAAAVKAAPPTSSQARDDWRVPAESITSVEEYDTKVKATTAEVHRLTTEINGITAAQVPIKNQIDDIKDSYTATIRGLHDQQDALNISVDATKTKYAGMLAPLEAKSRALARLSEDTKADFAKITDPLQAGLQQTTRSIQDAKTGFEAFAKPIQAQIDGIEKANTALSKQRALTVEIADLALRAKMLAAIGDPNARGDIAAKQQILEFAREDLERQKELLDLSNTKGNKDKQIADLQKQLDDNKRQSIGLDQQAANLVDRSATAEIAKQKIINDAEKEKTALLQANANIAADAAKAPLQAQLDDAKANLATLLDPLEAQAAMLSRSIQDVGLVEAASLAPIVAAQSELARKIQDTNQAEKDALAPIEEKQKAISAQINEQEAAERRKLAPLEANLQAMQRHTAELEIQKREQSDKIAALKDEKTELAERNAEAAKGAKDFDLSSGKKPGAAPGDATGTSPLVQFPQPPNETIEGFRQLAANVEASATAFDHLNAATGGGLAGSLGEIGKGLAIFAGLSVGEMVISKFGLAVIAALTPMAVFNVALTALVLLLTNQKGFSIFLTDLHNWTDDVTATIGQWFADRRAASELNAAFTKADDDRHMAERSAAWDAWLAERGKALDDWNTERTTAWNAFWINLGTDAAKGLNDLKAAQDAQLATWHLDWDAFWMTTMPAAYNAFWAGLEGIAKTGWDTLTGWLTPAVDGITKAFDPLLAVLSGINDAVTHIPTNIPAWVGAMLNLMQGGGGTRGVAYHPGQSAGWSDIPANSTAPILMGGDKDEIVRRAAEQFHLDLGIFSRQIMQESGTSLDTNLTSSAGARGPGQFMPGTAQEAANMLGVSIEDFWASAELQIMGAAAEMQKYVAQFGSYRNALIAYNAGPGAVGNYLPGETAGYLNSIMPNGEPGPWQGSGGADAEVKGNQALLLSYQPLIPVQAQLAAGTTALEQVQKAKAAADQAAAETARRLAEIQANGGRVTAAAVPPTVALGTAQQQNNVWAQQMADQQARLALIMQQQVPAGMLSAADSMKLFSSVLGPIERQIAGGEIGVGTLEFKLVDLARATGLNTDAWAKFSSGAIDSTAAMGLLIDSTAQLGPEFAAIAAYQRTAGSDTVEASLRWFQAAKNYGLAKAELAKAPAIPATPAAAGAAAPAGAPALNTAPIKAVGAAWDETKDRADAAGLSVTAYQDIVNALDVDKITEQTDAWNTGTDAIRSVSSAADDLIGTLNKATDAAHDLAKALNDLPSGSGVGSHAAGGFWPQGQASWVGEHGPEIAVPTSDMWVVPNSMLPRGVPAGSGSGGGHVVNINGNFLINTQAKNAAELAPALRDELAKIARNNGGPDRLFR